MRNFLINKNKNKGFTLIEFIVASGLAVIVILAAGSTFLLTRKLNNTAQSRIAIQQNLRNASIQLTRDARMAGTFGCFNTTAAELNPVLSSSVSFPELPSGLGVQLDRGIPSGFGVSVLDASNAPASIKAMNPKGSILVVVYGKGGVGVTTPASNLSNFQSLDLASHSLMDSDISQALNAGDNLVLSNCISGYTVKSNPSVGGTVNLSKSYNAGELAQAKGTQGELTLSRLYAVAYFIGEVNGVSSLLRTEIQPDGNWSSSPQLLAQGINSMNLSFGYIDEDTCSKSTTQRNETFTFSDQLSKKILPALVRMHLKYDSDVPDVTRKNNNPSEADYVIYASVRGGNYCTVY